MHFHVWLKQKEGETRTSDTQWRGVAMGGEWRVPSILSMFFMSQVVWIGISIIANSTECNVHFFSQSVSLTQYVVLSVRHPVLLFQLAYCLNDQAHFAWFTLGVPRGQLGGRRRHLMEDTLRWKTTFDGRRPSMEDDLRRKTTFDGRRPLTEDEA